MSSVKAEPPRKLDPVTEPLEQLRGELEQTRNLNKKDVDKALKALEIAAPKLSERLENLAEAAKRLKKDTKDLAKSVVKKDKPEIDEAKELLSRQEKLNQQVEQMKDMLKSDANAQDARQKEGRERMRDADDAVAMLKNPPQESKNALEESVANEDAKEQSASLDQASGHQNELAEVLEQLAEHYENLENGEGEKTRSGLRDKEEELGIKEDLDKRYGDLEETLELAEMSDADRLKALEQKLPGNSVMQDELRKRAENTLDNAKAELDELDNNPQQSEESNQQQAGNNQQKASDQDVKAAMEAVQQMAEQEVPKIQEDAQQANAEAATEELKKAKKSLEEAAQKGAQAMKNPAMNPEEKMQAMGEELAQAAKALEQAAEKAGEKAQEAKDPGQKAAAQKAQEAAKAAAQKAQQMAQQAQKGQSNQQQASGARRTTDPVEAYVWAYVAREQARKTPGQKANAVRANIHLNRIKKELNGTEIKGAETKAKEILGKM